jgi:transcriptional antiterminator
MQELIIIEQISQLLKYRDLRSVQKFLHRHSIPVIKLGRALYIPKEDFNRIVNEKINQSNSGRNVARRNREYRPQGENEIKYLSMLSKKLLEL